MEGVSMNKFIMNKLLAVFFILLTSLLSTTCLLDDPLKLPFQTYVPQNIGDGWEIATPASVGIDEEALRDLYRYAHESSEIWQIRSLLIIKDNKLVAESYMKDPADRINPTAVWSCTKQFVGVLTGIAVDQGLINIYDPISKYLPNVPPEKSSITIENLLTMSSGINYTNGGKEDTLREQKPSNIIDFFLGLGMRWLPGEAFNYNDLDPTLVSAILQKVTGLTLRDWAREVLFEKIGIRRLDWKTYKDGTTMGGWGILATPREMAKIGQLVLDEGKWKGEQIVSSEWINEMTSGKVIADMAVINNIVVGKILFGYLWWSDDIENKDKEIWMSGAGGQLVNIYKAKDLIAVITSEPNTEPGFWFGGGDVFERIEGILK